MKFDSFNAKPQGQSASALSLEDWDKPERTPEISHVPSSQRELTGHDIANLHPKEFRNVSLGLELYAPGNWRETKNSRSLQLHDMATGTKLKAKGFARQDVSIEKWVGMRLPMVTKEMPEMTQVTKPVAIRGENWGSRVQGIVAEYQGRLPGEDEDSHLLICCLRTDSMLISVTISAPAAVFAQNRAVYNWIFSRCDIGMAFPVLPAAAHKSGARTSTGTGTSSASSSTRNPSAPHTYDYVEIGNLASGMRLLNLAMLIFAGMVWSVQHFHMRGMQAAVMVFPFLALVAVMSAYGLIRMYRGSGWGRPFKVIVGILAFTPFVNILAILAINLRASSILRTQGYKIGLLGCKEAIPESNHDMSNVILLTVVLILAEIGYASYTNNHLSSAPETAMTEFSPAGQHFSINMPGKPVEQQLAAPPEVRNNHTYLAGSGKLQYAITYFDIADEPAEPLPFLEGIRDGIVSDLKAIIIEDKTLTREGKKGLSLKMTGKGSLKHMQLFIAGKTVYILEATAPVKEDSSDKIVAFMDSFHFK
ncbi:hypothetical protein ACO0LF_27935 [Undibacterium sp. Di27W]|uniref:hypothetical protein n=1 Tax=Undibacterium sp. Di27W TaxID=3413036 RepID=UPI003BF35017